MAKGDRATARIHRDWLRSLPTVLGMPLSQIAKETKIASSTLYRPLKEGEHGVSTLHANTIAKIVEHTGAPFPAENGLRSVGRRPPRGTAQDAVPYSVEPGDEVDLALKAFSHKEVVLAPYTLRTRAVELAGAMPGDVLLLNKATTPTPGDLVMADVRGFRSTDECLVRVFERAAPVDLLVTRSLDPGLQAPLVVDGERVVLRGVFLPHRFRVIGTAA